MKKFKTLSLRFLVGFFALSVLAGLCPIHCSAGFPGKEIPKKPICIGIELGSSIDMSSHDQSTIDIDIVTGFRNRALQTLGLGTGIYRSLGSKNTFIPVYVVCNTSFVSRPTLCFMHFKAGYSFNTIGNSPTFGGSSASLGLGFNLSASRNFTSHIILSYGFRHFNSRKNNPLQTDNLSLAQLSFGLLF